MARVKVLHFIHSLSGGGAEKQLRLLCQGMDSNRFDSKIFCVNSCGNDISTDQASVIETPYRARLNWKYLHSVFSAIKSHNPDIVHIWLPPSVSIPALVFSRFLGKKIIFSYRSKMDFFRLINYPEFILAVLFTDRIVSNHPVIDSHSAYRWLFNRKSGIVINNAVSVPEVFHRKVVSRSNVAQLIFVGRLTEQKNCTRLIKAMKTLINRTDWALNIYGAGKQEELLRDLIGRYKLTDRVFLNPFTENIYSKMATADALVLPSLLEGMPNVLVESLIMGLPVLASDIPANRSVIGDKNGVIWLDPYDPADIANRISKFLDNHYSVSEIVNVGRGIASQYTLQRMVESYQALYTSMKERSARGDDILSLNKK